jgi:tripartite-type tricarboxylate transporter receptor subunit TctC
MQTRRQLLTSAAALVAAGPAMPAFAQSWPQRPVKVVVAFAPGGNSDSIARIACQRLGDAFGQTFVIENRPGAGGALGAEAVARAAPDGYTLFSAATPQIAITPALQKVPYDPIKDFAPISNVGSNPFVLSVNAKLPIKSVAEFIAYVRARPGGQVTFGSGGVGTLNHLSMTMFAKLAGIDITHVPYKGGAPLALAVIAGEVEIGFADLPILMPHLRSGAMRALAIGGKARDPLLPDVPTMAEAGVAGYEAVAWGAFMVPAGTPDAIVNRLGDAVRTAYRKPEVIKSLADRGTDAVSSTRAELTALIAQDTERWGRVVREAKITLE